MGNRELRRVPGYREITNSSFELPTAAQLSANGRATVQSATGSLHISPVPKT